jgi:hypothetical protein
VSAESVVQKCNVARICGTDADDTGITQRDISKKYGVSKSTVGNHRAGDCLCVTGVTDMVKSVAQLLERSGIDPADIEKVEKVKLWQGMYKDEHGEAHTVDMTGVVLSPTWGDGPQWPVIEPAKPIILKQPVRAKAKSALDGFKRAMTLPDIQIGYYVDRTGALHPTHDESALDVVLQLIRFVRPDRIIMHGDNLDLPELSKYRLSPMFIRTTQATVDRAGLWAAEVRGAAGPDAEIEWLAGNHEERLVNYLLDNAKAAFGLRRAMEPKGWPVLSVPNLCRLDDHAITFLPGYPANEAWINDRLRVIHGHVVASGGSTAHKYLAQERVSTVFGHVHRREWAERTRRNRSSDQTILAMSPGCLCRTDGKVPSTKGGIDLDGLPLSSTEDWQQGVAVFTYEDGNGRFVPEQVPILDGWAVYHGLEFQASVDIEGIALTAA